MRRTLVAALAALALQSACISLEEFPNESIVTGPRVIAVVTEPPEVTPGRGLSVSPLVVDAEDVKIDYRICGTFDGPFGGGAQFGERDDEDCAGGALLSGSGPRWEVPAEVLQVLWDNADLLETILGNTLSPETVRAIRDSVGVPLLIDLTIEADGKELRATKRVLLSENPEPHTNPPPPAFKFGRHDEVGADPSRPWSCRADRPLRAEAGAKVELAPAVNDGDEAWVEPYRVINARGEVEERTERAFYSWFATGGGFESHLTRAPLRNQVWTAPKKSGRNRLWVVVRDGHGGESACGFDVRVEAPNSEQ